MSNKHHKAMTEQATTDLSVVEGEDLSSVTQTPEDGEELLELQNKQDKKCSILNSIEDSGRIMFKGEDMLFLTVNGIQMFTFSEIMLKLCHDTKRGTVGNRFTRLKATKHACNRAEIKLVKELGGTNPTFYNCTLVSRADVERYCEKYADNNGARTVQGNTRLSRPGKSSKCTKKQGLKDIDHVVTDQESKDIDLDISTPVVSSCSGDLVSEQNETDNNSQDLISDNNNMNVDEDCSKATKAKPKQSNIKRKKAKDITDHKKSNKADKKQIKKDKASLNRDSSGKKSTSKSVLRGAKYLNLTKIQVDKSSQKLSTVSTNTSISEQNTQDAGKKRKRRTQFELLQSYQFYTDIVEDETSTTDGESQQLKVDALSVDINSNIIDDQEKSSTKLEETRFDYDVLDLHSDDNNASSCTEPRSPTLLLKRSDNEWHVAKAVLPQLSFNDTESDEISDTVVKGSKNPVESKTAMTNVKDKLLKPTKKRKPSNATSKEPSGKKKKMNEGIRPLASIKKLGKKNLKKVNESNIKRKSSGTALHEQEKTNLEGNLNYDKDIADVKPDTSDNTSVSVQHENLDGRKSSLLLKDNTDNLNKTSDENKEKRENNDDGKVVKKKRRRRVEMNKFRLIETIPYPSLLVVKDGDLCPSYTMAYNQKNYLPGCCHPLWRWRLGKPVTIPSQSPMKTKDDQLPPVKTKLDDLSTVKNLQDEQSPVKTKLDDLSSVKISQDEQSPVKQNKDDESPIETKAKQDEQSPVKYLEDEPSTVKSRQDVYSVVNEKHDDPSPVKAKQDERPRDDAQSNEKEERSKLTEDKVTQENINTDVSTISVVSETNCIRN